MNFTVIGYGFVGKAVFEALKHKHAVEIYDPPMGFDNFDHNANGYIICVPTPEDDNGRCDSTLIEEYVSNITDINPQAHILIKSTTDVETLGNLAKKNLRTTFSPEFLRGSVSADPTKEFLEQDYVIFGGHDGRWWYEIFKEVLPIKEVRFLDIKTAGFLKYAENSFLATKVIFFNELRRLYYTGVGNNYDAMIEALALDSRIGMSHTQVPGPDGKYGFGGHCLPKDTSEFVEFANESGANLELLEKAREINEKYRGRET